MAFRREKKRIGDMLINENVIITLTKLVIIKIIVGKNIRAVINKNICMFGVNSELLLKI